MDWKTIAPIVGSVAPFAGKLLGGLIPFPGAALAGEALGNIIATQLGVPPTPQAVNDKLAELGSQERIAIINAAVEKTRVEVTGFAEIEKAYLHIQEVTLLGTQQLMAKELGHEHWFFNGWRPAAGWEFVIFAGIFGVILMGAGVLSVFFDRTQPLDRLTAAWPIFAAFFGTLAAMVGVYIIGRSQEKQVAIAEGVVPTPPAKKSLPGVSSAELAAPPVAKAPLPKISSPSRIPRPGDN